MEEWWRKGKFYYGDESNFLKIIDFYVFNCPVKGISQTAETFERKNWTNKNLTTLISEMKKSISPSKDNFIYIANGEIEDEYKRHDFTNNNYEFIIYKKSGELSQTESIFYHIRNAIAHGSFSIVNSDKGNIYYFQSKRYSEIKSRIRLKEETLLLWIDLFNSSASEIREKNKDRRQRKKYQNRKD